MTPAFLTNIPPMGYLIIALVVLVLFGRGKISAMMGEMGKGITAFKKGVNDSTNEIEDAASEAAKDVTPEAENDKSLFYLFPKFKESFDVWIRLG